MKYFLASLLPFIFTLYTVAQNKHAYKLDSSIHLQKKHYDEEIEFDFKSKIIERTDTSFTIIKSRWDEVSKKWELLSKRVIYCKNANTYNIADELSYLSFRKMDSLVNKRITYRWDTNTNNWEYSEKEEFTYDKNGNKRYLHSYSWEENKWQCRTKEDYRFYDNGKKTLTIYSYYDNSGKLINSTDTIKNLYNKNNQLTEHFFINWDLNRIKECQKTTIDYYTNGRIKERIHYSCSGNYILSHSFYKDEYLYNDEEKTRTVNHYKDTILTRGRVYYMDEDGRDTMVLEKKKTYDVYTLSKEAYKYDSSGNKTETKHFKYNNAEAVWEFVSEEVQEYYPETNQPKNITTYFKHPAKREIAGTVKMKTIFNAENALSEIYLYKMYSKFPHNVKLADTVTVFKYSSNYQSIKIKPILNNKTIYYFSPK